MKRVLVSIVLLLVLAACVCAIPGFWNNDWKGVDETVVERFASAAGRPPKPSVIEDSGDLKLLLFLLAGAAGGFFAGYYFRQIFPPGQSRRVKHESEL